MIIYKVLAYDQWIFDFRLIFPQQGHTSWAVVSNDKKIKVYYS